MTKKTLSADDIVHVAKLSNLSISEDEKNTFALQLSEVINYIEMLGEVDTEGVGPTSQTTGLVNVARKDELQVERTFDSATATSNGDQVYNDYFQVPMILKQRTLQK